MCASLQQESLKLTLSIQSIKLALCCNLATWRQDFSWKGGDELSISIFMFTYRQLNGYHPSEHETLELGEIGVVQW